MRPINRCFNKQLVDICQRSIELEELSKHVAQMLPADLAQACSVGSFNKGCLILTTNNATWASQLRYLLPELRDKLRKDAGMYQLTSIKINIDASKDTSYSPPEKSKPLVLSDRAKATLISESQHCTYEPLKNALLSLAEQ